LAFQGFGQAPRHGLCNPPHGGYRSRPETIKHHRHAGLSIHKAQYCRTVASVLLWNEALQLFPGPIMEIEGIVHNLAGLEGQIFFYKVAF